MPPCLLLFLTPDLLLSLIIASLRNFMFLYFVCWHLSINHALCDFHEMFLTKIYHQQKIRSGYLSPLVCPFLLGTVLVLHFGCQPHCSQFLTSWGTPLLCECPSFVFPRPLSPNVLKASASLVLLLNRVLGCQLIPLPWDFFWNRAKEALDPASRWKKKKAVFALLPTGQASRKLGFPHHY